MTRPSKSAHLQTSGQSVQSIKCFCRDPTSYAELWATYKAKHTFLLAVVCPYPIDNSNTNAVDEYPAGYGKLAAIEACDPNFLIYRKFAWLHNRLLLHKQDELYELEQRLERLDQSDAAQDPRRLKSRRRDEHVSPNSGRKELLKQIEGTLDKYRGFPQGLSNFVADQG